jgi:hypothetical protein
MYFRRKTSAGRAYLQIVESRRDGDQVRQQVIATLGRFEELQASGQLERLVRSGARFAAKALVLSAALAEGGLGARAGELARHGDRGARLCQREPFGAHSAPHRRRARLRFCRRQRSKRKRFRAGGGLEAVRTLPARTSCPDVTATLTTMAFDHSSLQWLEIDP